MDWLYTAVEGGPAPIEGWPEGSSVTTKRTGNVMQHIWKQGTGTETGRAVVSKDGKTMTYTMRGTNSKGEQVHDVLVFEKQWRDGCSSAGD